MREIKFRAWNKLSKRIAIVKHVIFDGSESGIEQAFVHYDNTPLNDDKWIPKDCLELMQYTGLKDKNGKEIYESDKIEFNPIGSEQVLRGVIEWLNDGWIINEDIDNAKFKLYSDVFGKPEIIGNIYED